ncbi:hypothetical protein AWN90_19495 [Nocardia terpenica]|uniref:DUF885 domain-containing protein n=1 Tax=Nocardia terpenica TaxID=455432 RepID=A0A164PH36_9NOCA|nr:hypothetical protein AWN90_19495 [Nocardia terpenica]NQE86043.1 DUF885 domain-containing protein [Nocardia terpenica]
MGTTDVGEILSRLRDDPALRYDTGEEIMADVYKYLAANTAMSDWFTRLPKQSCTPVPVPDFLAATIPAAFYYPPAADGSRPGMYFVNQHQPKTRSLYGTAAVTFHEAVPGHYLQLTIASELDHLPQFQRQSFSNTAFVEGWGLYAEPLADEMGLYPDPLARLRMLTSDSLRSCRLVVDTGLHSKGWTRQQAIDYMSAHAPISLAEIEVEVDRYITMRGQAVAYKIGQNEILRQRARTAERTRGSVRHQDIPRSRVERGAVSLPVLKELTASV